jgi:mannose-1-phosphate guanylyltransferase
MQPDFNLNMAEIPSDLFKQMPNISIDSAVMEKSNKVAVIPSNFGWNDIGSWKAIRDMFKPDSQQNRALGEAIFVDTQNTFVHSEDRLVAVVGMSDLMIIDTPDALLVVNPDKAQDVKKVVDRLKTNNLNAFKFNRPVARP